MGPEEVKRGCATQLVAAASTHPARLILQFTRQSQIHTPLYGAQEKRYGLLPDAATAGRSSQVNRSAEASQGASAALVHASNPKGRNNAAAHKYINGTEELLRAVLIHTPPMGISVSGLGPQVAVETAADDAGAAVTKAVAVAVTVTAADAASLALAVSFVVLGAVVRHMQDVLP